jgi:hypothetical protein
MKKDYRPKPGNVFSNGSSKWRDVLEAASGILMFHKGDAGPRRAAREHFYTAANYLDELAKAGHLPAIRRDGRTWRDSVLKLEQGMQDDFASAFDADRTGCEVSTRGTEAVLKMAEILDDYIAEQGAE